MRVVVAGDQEALGARLRELLLREGHDCKVDDLVSLDLALSRLVLNRPDVLIVAVTPDPERALTLVREVRQLQRIRVLAVGPAYEPKLILQALREGADQYLDEADLEGELTAALGRLQTDVGAPAELGRLITVLGPSGGSGASTIAANLAAVLARQHQSCALVDLKLETGDLAALFDLKPTHTLAELCLNASRMDRGMLERCLVRHDSGVHLLAPPRVLADVACVTPQGIRQALNLARTLFPYVVVDLDHSFREEQTLVLRQADLILLVFRLDFTSLRNARRTLDYFDQLGISQERVRLVVNRYGQPKELAASKAEEALGLKIFHYVPDEPKTVNRANNSGVPAVLEAPRASICKSLARLATSVNGKAETP